MDTNIPKPFTGPGGDPTGAFSHRPAERPRWWLHILLFVLTLVSSTVSGGLYYGWLESPDILVRISDPKLLFEGLKFSLPLLTILFAHEMGHYIAARRHGLRVTPPFFLPMPVPLPYNPWTLGAVIRVKEPIRTRRQLMDVGAAGPIVGFVAILPFLALAACGVDGPPVPPKDVEERPEPGVRISGSVSMGVTGGSTTVRR